MSYLIKDTTKEERKEIVKNALAISLLDAGEPTDETKELINLYIDGNMELDEVKSKVLERYKKEVKN